MATSLSLTVELHPELIDLPFLGRVEVGRHLAVRYLYSISINLLFRLVTKVCVCLSSHALSRHISQTPRLSRRAFRDKSGSKFELGAAEAEEKFR